MRLLPRLLGQRAPRLSLSEDLGQVQLALEGRDLFSQSKNLVFLGAEAARSIGDGARWRHPFPQEWPWPPKEPVGLDKSCQGGVYRLGISDPDFLRHYGARPWLTVYQKGADTHMKAELETLSGAPKQAWIVAPFAMPSGHSLGEPQAMAVFPVVDTQELEPLHLGEGDAGRTWDHDADRKLMFVTPGADLKEAQQKAYFSARDCVFGRSGDAQVMLLSAGANDVSNSESGPVAENSKAFQVFAGIHDYLELEWAGASAAHSQVEVVMRPVSLASLHLEIEGRPLERLGQTGAGLKAELAAVAGALNLEL